MRELRVSLLGASFSLYFRRYFKLYRAKALAVAQNGPQLVSELSRNPAMVPELDSTSTSVCPHFSFSSSYQTSFFPSPLGMIRRERPIILSTSLAREFEPPESVETYSRFSCWNPVPSKGIQSSLSFTTPNEMRSPASGTNVAWNSPN